MKFFQGKHGLWWLLWAGLATAFPGPAAADEVQLDRVDNAVRARLDRVEAQLADRHWDEAVENLRQLAELPDGGLVAVSEGRFVELREWCQRRLAALPPEALKIYRGRVDPLARHWYERGVAERNRRLLQQVVDRATASSYGDEALLALGDMDLESGRFDSARWCWQRILPGEDTSGSATLSWHYPDTNLEPAAIRARLVLASILDGRTARARTELARFSRLHPDAQGRLGGQEGKYVDLLESLLTESATWPAAAPDPDWLTFAGNARRNKTAGPVADIGAVAWRIPIASPLPLGEGTGVRAAPRRVDAAAKQATLGEGPGVRALSYHPLLYTPRADVPSAAKRAGAGQIVLLNTSSEIMALRLDDGRPAWGRSPTIYRSELSDRAERQPASANAADWPQYTMTIFGNRLFARLGSSDAAVDEPASLVCLDLAAEGRLLWKIAPGEGWAFDGSPLADDQGVYVAMRRPGVRPQAFVACLETDTGRIRWRRFVCGAATPAQNATSECSNNLLTLAKGTIYFNTNLGAVAAMRAEDGRIEWLSLYPRTPNGRLKKGATAGLSSSAAGPSPEVTAVQAGSGTQRRGPNPCLFNGGTLFVAPADDPCVLAFNAADGRLLWHTGSAVEDGVGLLGATDDYLIAGGGRFYWIGLHEKDRGQIMHIWPEGGERPGFGRGLSTKQHILWSTRDKLYILDRQTARPLATIDLRMRGASGGNLLSAPGKLLIATDSELIAIGYQGDNSTLPPGIEK